MELLPDADAPVMAMMIQDESDMVFTRCRENLMNYKEKCGEFHVYFFISKESFIRKTGRHCKVVGEYRVFILIPLCSMQSNIYTKKV